MSATTAANDPRRAGAPEPPGHGVRVIDLLLGLPALAVALGLTLVVVRQGRRTDLPQVYAADVAARRDALARDLQAPKLTSDQKMKELQSILIDYRRLVELNPASQENRLGLAVTYEGLGQLGRAESLMRGLAPADGRPGYIPAHLWLGTRLAGAARNDAMRVEAAKHLKLVLAEQPNNLDVRISLADLLARTGQLREARSVLEEVVTKEPFASEPFLLMTLSKVCRQLNDNDEARRLNERAEGLLRSILVRQPNSLKAAAYLAMLFESSGEYRKAIAELDRVSGPNVSPEFRRNASLVFAGWYDHLKKTGAPPAQMLEVVEEALKRNPEDTVVLVRLAEMTSRVGPEGDRARARFEELGKRPTAPSVVHFVLGNTRLAAGNRAEARAHWEKAIAEAKSPEDQWFAAYARNNLAFALAYYDPTDTARALTVIDEAIRARPQDVMFRGTRGEVLVKLGRFKEAAGELELVKANTPQVSAEIHKALAVAYDRLGEPDRSAKEESLAALAAARSPQANPGPSPAPTPPPVPAP